MLLPLTIDGEVQKEILENGWMTGWRWKATGLGTPLDRGARIRQEAAGDGSMAGAEQSRSSPDDRVMRS